MVVASAALVQSAPQEPSLGGRKLSAHVGSLCPTAHVVSWFSNEEREAAAKSAILQMGAAAAPYLGEWLRVARQETKLKRTKRWLGQHGVPWFKNRNDGEYLARCSETALILLGTNAAPALENVLRYGGVGQYRIYEGIGPQAIPQLIKNLSDAELQWPSANALSALRNSPAARAELSQLTNSANPALSNLAVRGLFIYEWQQLQKRSSVPGC